MVLRVRTFGECVMEIGGRRITPDAEIVFAMLLLLVFECGERVPREKLRRYLWPSLPESADRQRFRQALYKVRRMAHIPVEVTATHVSLKRDAVDADFLRLLEPGWADVFIAAEAPNGEFLPGYCPTFSAPFAEWLEAQRDLVHSRTRIAVSAAIASGREHGDWDKVERLARRCLKIDPLNHDATVSLAEAIAVTGRKIDAIAVLDSYIAEGQEPTASPYHVAAALRRRIAARFDDGPLAHASPGGRVFVGRRESMQLLLDCARATRSGTATAVHVWGEPGIGKSRLLEEFSRGAMIEGWVVRRVSCQAGDAQRPLAVFTDLTPLLRTLPGALGCSPESSPFLDILSSGSDGPFGMIHTAEESEALAAGIRRALFDLLDAVTSESRILIVVEDAHLADSTSLELLRDVVGWMGARQMQLVMTSRTPPAFRAPERLAPRLVVHQLAPLSAQETDELLRRIASNRGRSLEHTFVAWAVRVADGNPFYLRELLNRWLQTNELYSVPPTLAALLHNRIAGLEKRDLRLLQTCAALRRQSRPDRLQAMLGLGNLDLIESMEALGTAGLLVVRGEHTECKHELISDAALAQLNDSGRQALFRMAAGYLEREASESIGMSLLWDCAQLWHDAGDAERAVRTGVTFARRLGGGGYPSDAARLSENMIRLCDTREQTSEVYATLIDCQRLAGQWKALANSVQARREFLEPSDSISVRFGEEELLLLEARWRVEGDPHATLEHAERILGQAELSPAHRFEAATVALNVADSMCMAAKADSIFGLGSALTHEGGIDASALARFELMYHTPYGDLARALRAAEEHVRLERVRERPADLARALRYASLVFRRTGQHSRAVKFASEALALARAHQIGSAVITTLTFLADCYLDSQDFVRSEHWYRCARSLESEAEDRHLPLDLTGIGVQLAIAHGDRATARDLASGLLEFVEKDKVLRRRIYALAVWTLAETSMGRAIPQETLSNLATMYCQTREYGAQDTPAVALCAGHIRSGNPKSAAELWHSHIQHWRRERWMPPRHELLSEIEAMQFTCEYCESTAIPSAKRSNQPC